MVAQDASAQQTHHERKTPIEGGCRSCSYTRGIRSGSPGTSPRHGRPVNTTRLQRIARQPTQRAARHGSLFAEHNRPPSLSFQSGAVSITRDFATAETNFCVLMPKSGFELLWLCLPPETNTNIPPIHSQPQAKKPHTTAPTPEPRQISITQLPIALSQP